MGEDSVFRSAQVPRSPFRPRAIPPLWQGLGKAIVLPNGGTRFAQGPVGERRLLLSIGSGVGGGNDDTGYGATHNDHTRQRGGRTHRRCTSRCARRTSGAGRARCTSTCACSGGGASSSSAFNNLCYDDSR